MSLSEQHLLDAISRMPFVDSAELALILGEPHTTVHRTLASLLAEDIVGRVSHGTAHLPSSQRYNLTASGVGIFARVLGFATLSDSMRAYSTSREWLALHISGMSAVASINRIDTTVTFHEGRITHPGVRPRCPYHCQPHPPKSEPPIGKFCLQ